MPGPHGHGRGGFGGPPGHGGPSHGGPGGPIYCCIIF